MSDKSTRHRDLRQMLNTRRRELMGDLQGRLRDGRTEHSRGTGDSLEQADARAQGDLEFSLIQMRTESLARINEALRRLDAGTYGSCAECEDEITERRLHAVPFAVRCQECEGKREQAQGSARRLAERINGSSVFPA